MVDYRFPQDIRRIVATLIQLCSIANNKEEGGWANQGHADAPGGVYGHAFYTIRSIIVEVWGAPVAARWEAIFEFEEFTMHELETYVAQAATSLMWKA